MARFTILASNFPLDIYIALAGSINAVKGLKGDAGIVLIHELPEITSLNLPARISKYPAESVVEKPEIPVEVDLIKPIGHCSDEHPVAIRMDLDFFKGRIAVFFLGAPARFG
jgi:hypothetical protein